MWSLYLKNEHSQPFISVNQYYLYEKQMNMKRNIVKLNEAQLKKMIVESVRRVLNESRPGLMMRIEGSDFLDNVFYEVDSVSPEEEDMFSDWYENYRGQDPAIDKIADNEFTVYAIAGYHNWQDEGGQNDVDFEITDDDGLWDLIGQIRNPRIKKVAMKEYDIYCNDEDNYYVIERDY